MIHMEKLKRRQFLKLIGGSAIAAALPVSFAQSKAVKPKAAGGYKVDLLVKICEGSAQVKLAWVGPKNIPLSDFKVVDGKTGIKTLTGSDCDELSNLCCAMFENYQLPHDYKLGNFSFAYTQDNIYWVTIKQGEFIFYSHRNCDFSKARMGEMPDVDIVV